MAKIEKFEDLEIWQIARDLCNDVWSLIKNTPLENDYKLRNQMNGSSGSVNVQLAGKNLQESPRCS